MVVNGLFSPCEILNFSYILILISRKSTIEIIIRIDRIYHLLQFDTQMYVVTL